jgi:hypothetical protein
MVLILADSARGMIRYVVGLAVLANESSNKAK